MENLPFENIIAVDFEYAAPEGERPEVACMVAKDLSTGQTWRLFKEDLAKLSVPPYPMGEETVVLEAGDTLTVAAGLVHHAVNVGEEDAEMIVAYSSGVRDFVVEAEG